MAVEFATAEAVSAPKGSPAVRGARRVVAAVPSWAWVLALYASMSLVTIGRFAVVHMQTRCACEAAIDPSLFMWGLSWWPHAIVNGVNPFVSHLLWTPVGIDTAQLTFLPTAAIPLGPLTELFGPVFSYNVLAIASPALSSLTAYLLCRRIAGRQLPAIVGGYLFGFSAYEFAQLTGHLNLTLVFLIPAMVHVALRRIDREISRRAYVIAMALLIILQAGLSTELLAECVGFGAILLVAAYLLTPRSEGSRVASLVGETVGAGVLALVVAAPFFYYALLSGGFPQGSTSYWDMYALDLLNPLFPTYATWLGHDAFKSLSVTYSGGGLTGQDGYLSIPVIAIFLLWALKEERKRLRARLLLVAAATTFVVALGAHLHVAGYQTITLPLDWTKELPIFNDIIPSRIAMFTTLAVSIGFAAWLATPGRHTVGRWLVAAVAVVAIFPNVTQSLYGEPPKNPRFFSTAMYRHYLKQGETVLVLPYAYNGSSDLWQAETGFYFYMPEGYAGQVVPPSFLASTVAVRLLQNTPPPASELGTFIRQHYVSDVVVELKAASLWSGVMRELGLSGRAVGGVILYPVRGAPA